MFQNVARKRHLGHGLLGVVPAGRGPISEPSHINEGRILHICTMYGCSHLLPREPRTVSIKLPSTDSKAQQFLRHGEPQTCPASMRPQEDETEIMSVVKSSSLLRWSRQAGSGKKNPAVTVTSDQTGLT
ncbi:hypothetical protein AOLI_G00254870 [Acnodon oligacanthus]